MSLKSVYCTHIANFMDLSTADPLRSELVHVYYIYVFYPTHNHVSLTIP